MAEASPAKEAKNPGATGVEKKQSRQGARREAILDVARSHFLTHGYAATSMSMIAAELGGSKGTLYNYFPNKEQLFAAVMRRASTTQAQALFHRPTGQGVEATLYGFGRGLLEFILSERSLAMQRVIIAEAQRFPALGTLFYENGPGLVAAQLAKLFEQLAEQQQLTIVDAPLAANHFMDLLLSDLYRRTLWGLRSSVGDGELDKQAACAVDYFLRLYGRAGGDSPRGHPG